MTFYAKLWTDIIGDEKLMRGARKGGKQLVLLPWLIAFAKKADDNGRLSIGEFPAEPDDIAAGIPGVTPKQVNEGLQSLKAIGVLVADDDDVLRFAAWRKRNWMSPSDTPDQVRERVANHRARKRGETTPVTPDANDDVTTPVTEDVTKGVTESVTTPVTTARSRDEDEDRDLDRDKDSSSSSARTTSVALRLVTGTARLELDRLLSHVPVRESWISEMDAALEGMHGVTLTPEQLGQAIHDYVGNGAASNPSLKHFRGYLRSAAAPANGTKTRSPANGARHRSRMNPGEQQVANILGTHRRGES